MADTFGIGNMGGDNDTGGGGVERHLVNILYVFVLTYLYDFRGRR